MYLHPRRSSTAAQPGGSEMSTDTHTGRLRHRARWRHVPARDPLPPLHSCLDRGDRRMAACGSRASAGASVPHAALRLLRLQPSAPDRRRRGRLDHRARRRRRGGRPGRGRSSRRSWVTCVSSVSSRRSSKRASWSVRISLRTASIADARPGSKRNRGRASETSAGRLRNEYTRAARAAAVDAPCITSGGAFDRLMADLEGERSGRARGEGSAVARRARLDRGRAQRRPGGRSRWRRSRPSDDWSGAGSSAAGTEERHVAIPCSA